MNYGNPKVLPNTGGGAVLIGALSFQQSIIIAIAAAVITTLALIGLRTLWRSGRALHER